MAKYYRALRMLAGAIPSHMQLWADDEGPFLIQDWRMMFGCRAAAAFATRVSGFVTWLVHEAMRHVSVEALAQLDGNEGAGSRWSKLLTAVRAAKADPKAEEPQLARDYGAPNALSDNLDAFLKRAGLAGWKVRAPVLSFCFCCFATALV